MLVLWVALGGALGAVARYLLTNWIQSWAGDAFPVGTFVVNVTGSFLLGFLLRALDGIAAPPEARALLATGVLGAFTTFSTFSYEVVGLLHAGERARAAIYALGSLAVGVVCVVAGIVVASAVLPHRG